MRLKLRALAFAGAILVAAPVLAPPALAQGPDDDCKGGTVEVIRLSKLKDGATIDDFKKAVDKHMAWYRAHGYTKNKQVVATVLTRDGVSKTEVVTIHTDAPGVPKDKQDAGWGEFVAAYRAVSDIVTELPVCVPNK